ncbi:hypothetical protein [Bradyrhizobium sp. sBnM-33]|uniref:hypothetical protein n=1 Tax=Bradyrhizobium sp. sBnM-33 TaxID=2831780 RepID=UPI001BD14906|nr:hypothetical protein [Bradyrhizobium sp. sBnM-33]WOH52411.1 hypothetical protein RX328_09600 [Bradyrhizobium sp. sBnM-33]
MTAYIFVGIFSIIKTVVGVGYQYVQRIEPLAKGCAAERTAIPPNGDMRLPGLLELCHRSPAGSLHGVHLHTWKNDALVNQAIKARSESCAKVA